ncbi:DUF393 domain-containing protein [Marinilabiliaceae bacterium ANBcel2]|nr:DUF393 domain-containing protein [Marinilabiliaceae bacterium ANBcel2]
MILLYDGYCVLCSGLVRRLVKIVGDNISVIPMQSTVGEELLKNYNIDLLPDEVILLKDKEIIRGADAIIELMRLCGRWWRFTAKVISTFFPAAFVHWGYKRVAKYRFFLFGRRKSCYYGDIN